MVYLMVSDLASNYQPTYDKTKIESIVEGNNLFVYLQFLWLYYLHVSDIIIVEELINFFIIVWAIKIKYRLWSLRQNAEFLLCASLVVRCNFEKRFGQLFIILLIVIVTCAADAVWRVWDI